LIEVVLLAHMWLSHILALGDPADDREIAVIFQWQAITAAEPFRLDPTLSLERFNDSVARKREKVETFHNCPTHEKPGGMNDSDHVSAPSCGFLRSEPVSRIVRAQRRRVMDASIAVEAMMKFDFVLDLAHPRFHDGAHEASKMLLDAHSRLSGK
jgi:hypothetical protein